MGTSVVDHMPSMCWAYSLMLKTKGKRMKQKKSYHWSPQVKIFPKYFTSEPLTYKELLASETGNVTP